MHASASRSTEMHGACARTTLRGLAGGSATASRWLVLAVASALSIGLACAGERPAKTGEIKPDVIYHNYCSVCHGDQGDGKSRAQNSLVPPPKDFSQAANLTREYMIAITTHGKPGTAMVSWKTQLNDKEIEAVVDYIMAAFVQTKNDPRIVRGKVIYQQTCSVCHGDKGQGAAFAAGGMTRPPRNFTAPQAKLELTRERMIAAVTHGRPGTAMAGFSKQMPGQDIEAVVDYVRTAIMHVSTSGNLSGTSAHGGRERDAGAAAAATAANMALPYPDGLKGDAAKGEKFYMDNCATCHGKKGDGKGPRAYFINPKPRDFIDATSRGYLNRPAIYAAVAKGSLGTEMPAWRFVMSEQEMANVSEFVFARFIKPANTAQAGKAAK